MSHIVDLSSIKCKWCGMSSNDVRIFSCPACGHPTCYECVYLYEEGMSCKHMTPASRGVLTAQEWTDDAP